ncbi:hypothetical protein ACI65C_011407 [Semiaphis heraclei]
MSSSSSLRASKSNGQLATIDAENSENHNSCSNDRSESCPADLIRDPVVHKIIFDRDLALASLSIAIEAANLAIESLSVSTEVATAKTMVNVVLDAVEEIKILANLARFISRRNSRSHGAHGLHG